MFDTPIPAVGLPETIRSLRLRFFNSADAVTAVKAGFTMETVGQLEAYLDISTEDLAQAVNIESSRLVPRHTEHDQRLRTDESERILRIGLLVDRAEEVLNGRAEAREWLLRPCEALGGVSPLLYASTEPGAREVERLLGRLEEGVFS